MDGVYELRERLAAAEAKLTDLTWDRPPQQQEVIRSIPPVESPERLGALIKQVDRCGRNMGLWWLQPLHWLDSRWQMRRLRPLALAIHETFCKHMGSDVVTRSISCQSLGQMLHQWLPVSEAVAAAQCGQELKRVVADQLSLTTFYERYAQLQAQLKRLTLRSLRSLALSAGSGIEGQERERLAELWAGVQNHQGRIGTGRSTQFERALRATFPVLMRHMPLWATTNLSAGRDLPLAPTFDLLIVDEASQCDIASVVPLLFRCKRVMVVGDPIQLSHVSTLSLELDWRLRQQFGLTDVRFERYTHRVNSFFQLASTSRALTLATRLQDHHRSHPAIAEYCNEAFYGGTLRVATAVDRLRPPIRHGQGGFCWTPVPSDAIAAPGGGAISDAQTKAILEELRRLLEERFAGTVGVVSPFRCQANRIRDQVEAALGDQVPAGWQFHVDTADGFQGDERDVILFSLVGGGEECPRGALWFLRNSPNRFNVAVSRARAVLHVFADEQWAQSCGIPHIEQLWRSCRQATPDASMVRTDLIGPVWEPRLAEALRAAELPFHQQYSACGRYLDFALLHEGLKLDVEVDGEEHHRDYDGRRKIDDLRRDLVLVAAGWTVQRFWVYELKQDMAGCVRQIKELYQGRKPADAAEERNQK